MLHSAATQLKMTLNKYMYIIQHNYMYMYSVCEISFGLHSNLKVNMHCAMSCKGIITQTRGSGGLVITIESLKILLFSDINVYQIYPLVPLGVCIIMIL